MDRGDIDMRFALPTLNRRLLYLFAIGYIAGLLTGGVLGLLGSMALGILLFFLFLWLEYRRLRPAPRRATESEGEGGKSGGFDKI